MKQQSFYDSINHFIHYNANQYRETDFGCLLTAKYRNKKLSITVENISDDTFLHDSPFEIPKFLHELDFSKDVYYGIHPSFDNTSIMNLLISGEIDSIDSLTGYCLSNRHLFNLYNQSSKVVCSMYKKVILQTLSKFGVKCKIQDNLSYDYVKEQWKEFQNLYLKFDDKYKNIYLLGSNSETSIAHLQEKGIYLTFDPNGIMIGKTNTVKTDIRSAFTKENIQLVYGKAYYNGVQPKLIHILEKDNWFTNDGVITLTLYVTKTTFFTVDAFDNHFQNDNCLLTKDDVDNIKDFFHAEDQRHRQLFHDLQQASANHIVLINNYLRDSVFTNIVNVSANLITTDKRLIIARRSQNVMDHNHLYPSVNGTSEFNDENVSFYRQSVLEDIPTLQSRSNQRMDFNNELMRETIAELNVNNLINKWKYVGMTLIASQNRQQSSQENSDDKPKKHITNLINTLLRQISKKKNKELKQNQDETKELGIVSRKFHFNVLAFNHVNETSQSIIDDAKTAVEAFEHKKLYMIYVRLANSWLHFIFLTIWTFLKKLMDFQVIFFILLGLLNVWLLNDKEKGYAFFFSEQAWNNPSVGLDSTLKIVGIVLSIGAIIKVLIDYLKSRKHNREVNLIKTTFYKGVQNYQEIVKSTLRKIQRSEKEKKVRFNPVTLSLYCLYLNSLVEKSRIDKTN